MVVGEAGELIGRANPLGGGGEPRPMPGPATRPRLAAAAQGVSIAADGVLVGQTLAAGRHVEQAHDAWSTSARRGREPDGLGCPRRRPLGPARRRCCLPSPAAATPASGSTVASGTSSSTPSGWCWSCWSPRWCAGLGRRGAGVAAAAVFDADRGARVGRLRLRRRGGQLRPAGARGPVDIARKQNRTTHLRGAVPVLGGRADAVLHQSLLSAALRQRSAA